MHIRSSLPARRPWHALPVFALVLCAAQVRASEPTPQQPGYETGLPAIQKINNELYTALDAKKRGQIQKEPIVLEQLTTPCLAPALTPDGSGQTVEFSAGFIALINQFSHAKAIEEAEKGFLKKFAATLAGQTGEKALTPLATEGTKFWDADTMNYQVGNFNQMAGTLIAIDLAHHYLGHYKKYAPQLSASNAQPVPINSLLTEKEWREAVLKGARNALDCGYGVDGIRCVYDTLGSMSERPPWVAYFIHPKANVSKINSDLLRLEKDFFLVGK
jgi:hypothetical protein